MQGRRGPQSQRGAVNLEPEGTGEGDPEPGVRLGRCTHNLGPCTRSGQLALATPLKSHRFGGPALALKPQRAKPNETLVAALRSVPKY